MDPVKVLYFHQHFSTPSGAAGTRSYEMARRLVARGHQVLMVCGSAGRAHTGLTGPFTRGVRRGMVDGLHVLELRLPYSNRFGLLRRSWIFLRFALRSVVVALTEPCDLVFATTTPLTTALPGIAARWLRGRPFVFEVRDLWPELPRAMGVIRNPLILWVLKVLEWVSYRSAQRLVGLSPGIVDGIAARGVDRARVALVPNGCDLAIFGAPAAPWRPGGVAAGDLMAVFAGAHGIANGLDAVLDAAAALRDRGRTDIKVVLVGEGMLKPRLVSRAEREGLTNVVFVDPVPKGRLAALLAAAHLGLQILDDVPAFYRGTSPNKFFDYLAAGRPVLINYPGWLAEVVLAHGCGYAVPPRDRQAFADALVHAADHREALPGMGARALRLARGQFDRAALAERFVDWLEGAVKR